MSKYNFTSAGSLLASIMRHQKWILLAMVSILLIIAICNLFLPSLSVAMIDDGMIAHNSNVLIKNALLSFLMSSIISICYVLVETLRIKGYNNIQNDLKERAVRKMLTIRTNFFQRQSATAIYQQIDEDINTICGCFSSEILLTIARLVITFALIPVLVGISWKMTIIVLCAIPIFYIKSEIIAKFGYKTSKEKKKAQKNYSQWFSDILSGINTIRCQMPFGHVFSSYKTQQENYAHCYRNTSILQEIAARLEGLLLDSLVFVLYLIGSYSIVRNEITVGQFIAFQTYSSTLLNLIGDVLGLLYGYSMLKPSIERFIQFEKSEDETSGTLSLEGVQMDIAFHNVTFCYYNGEVLLDQIDLSIPHRTHIGIEGGNGCGKTTLINLLLRFIDPQKGTIKLGEHSISEYEMKGYRSLFSIIPQHPYLFCDSIQNNICLFRKVDISRLLEIIHRVGLEKLVEEKGFDYCVGQDGCELSGGQKQKICLARALLIDTPFLILDEPETYLDKETREILITLLKEQTNDRTVIVITHNEEILKMMDCVYVFGENRT